MRKSEKFVWTDLDGRCTDKMPLYKNQMRIYRGFTLASDKASSGN